MIARPFTIRPLEKAAAGVLDVIMRFSGTAAPDEDGLRLAQRVMTHFTSVAASGGFANSSVPPIESTLSLSAEHLAPDKCAWRFKGVSIAPAARTVIENLAYFVHLNVAPIVQLDLVVPVGSPLARSRNLTEAFVVPPPFKYSFEPDAADVVVDVDFALPVEDSATRDRFVRFWESWVFVSAAGGFETEDWSARTLSIFPAGEPESYPEEMSLFMEDVSVIESAFDALVNGFHQLHFTAAPLSRLHIY